MTRHAFSYAVLCVVPDAERGESINAGVIVFCHRLDVLTARTHLDRGRLAALDPSTDAEAIEAQLRHYRAVCAGDSAAGPASTGPAGRRFAWLTAPRSTVVQARAVHSGLTDNAGDEADRLHARLVVRRT